MTKSAMLALSRHLSLELLVSAAAPRAAAWAVPLDAAVRIQAVDVLGRLGDTDSLEALVGLLECADPALARVALTALKQLSGRSMGADPARWYTWYDAELAWYERGFRDAVDRSRSADPGAASAALRELSEHRLLASEVLPVLVDALDHGEPGVVVGACNALQRLDRPAAIPPLVSLVGDHRPGVDAAVTGCLRALAREPDVVTPMGWRVWLER